LPDERRGEAVDPFSPAAGSPEAIARDLNLLARFLALWEPPEGGEPPAPVDCLVLLGNAVLRTAERAFAALRAGRAPLLLISGGVGHSTPALCAAVARHPRYRGVGTAGRGEAEILGELAREVFGIEPGRLLLETASTNCGENATLTRRALEERDVPRRSLLLLQDPTMQRRSDASFRQAFRDLPEATFQDDPTFVPRVKAHGGALAFDDPAPEELWPMERFISLAMGELPRLRDDALGYGPRGRGFIPHVDIPPPVEAAHARLLAALGKGDRG
jgi:uncharacterized SAM-binding protein YcdF (DUF218 family)